MIEFTCKNESSLIEVTELRFSSRYMSIEDEQFEKMKQTALDAGIPAEIVDKVQRTDQYQCQIGEEIIEEDKVDRIKQWASDSYTDVINWWKGNSNKFLQ